MIPRYTKITLEFRMRIHPIAGAYKLHTGTDILAPIGANYVAMADEIVINASYNSAYQNREIIDHWWRRYYTVCTWKMYLLIQMIE